MQVISPSRHHILAAACRNSASSDACCVVQILAGVAESLQGREVDAVLLVDRLDFYRVEELDKQVSVVGSFSRQAG